MFEFFVRNREVLEMALKVLAYTFTAVIDMMTTIYKYAETQFATQ